MEFKSEIIQKAFAPYLGQRCQVKGDEHRWPDLILKGLCQYGCEVRTESGKLTFYVIESEVRLILSPLSAMTDEHAIEMVRIHGGPDFPEKMIIHREEGAFKWIAERRNKSGKYTYPEGEQFNLLGNRIQWHNGVAYDGGEYSELNLEGYQYLESNGYDLPHYLLGAKTFKEAGLAVYSDPAPKKLNGEDFSDNAHNINFNDSGMP